MKFVNATIVPTATPIPDELRVDSEIESCYAPCKCASSGCQTFVVAPLLLNLSHG